LKDTFNTSK